MVIDAINLSITGSPNPAIAPVEIDFTATIVVPDRIVETSGAPDRIIEDSDGQDRVVEV